MNKDLQILENYQTRMSCLILRNASSFIIIKFPFENTWWVSAVI